MKKQLIYILLVIIYGACDQFKEKNKEHLELAPSESNVIEDDFKYREILDSVDIIHDRELWDCVFGDWFINSIAKVGGSFFEERKIQNQIGRHLTFDDTVFSIDFLGDKYTLERPIYEIEAIDNEAGTELKGTSIFYGYQMCRDSVFKIIVSGVDSLNQEHTIYLELISCSEICTYYDGRIYFFRRRKKLNAK